MITEMSHWGHAVDDTLCHLSVVVPGLYKPHFELTILQLSIIHPIANLIHTTIYSLVLTIKEGGSTKQCDRYM